MTPSRRAAWSHGLICGPASAAGAVKERRKASSAAAIAAASFSSGAGLTADICALVTPARLSDVPPPSRSLAVVSRAGRRQARRVRLSGLDAGPLRSVG